jgi:hypothetical protein
MTYSSSLSMGRQRLSLSQTGLRQPAQTGNWTKNQNTAKFSDKRRLGPVSNTIMLIVLTCLLGLLYLTQVTKANAYGYSINDLNQEQSKLSDEKDQLEVAAARLQALDRVKNSNAAKTLVSVAPSATLQN